MEEGAQLVHQGDYIIIERQNIRKLHQVKGKGCVMVGKDRVEVGEAVGRAVSTLYRMVPTGPRHYRLQPALGLPPSTALGSVPSPGTDNRHIVDDNTSQRLSTEEIASLREEGASSRHIVASLVANSASFQHKTEYSQQKYLRKKQDKYGEFVRVRRPSLRLLAQLLFSRDQFKILGLRYDSLSQMVTALNIQPGGNYLVYERGTQGLVGAAVLTHLDPAHSTLINLTPGVHPQKQAILALNFPPDKMNAFLSVKILSLLQLLKGETTDETGGGSETRQCGVDGPPDRVVEEKSGSENHHGEEEERGGGKRKRGEEEEGEGEGRKRVRWQDDLRRAGEVLRAGGADGLVVATREYPGELLEELIPLVRGSRPLVVFCPFREPLARLYVELKQRGRVLNLRLTETFLREYQVLEDRTHPHVNMTPSSGFLLTSVLL